MKSATQKLLTILTLSACVAGGLGACAPIVNEIGILGNTTLTQRSSDALVTGRVRASMVDAKDIFSNSFKVVTERGTTYLMGRVTQREANRATDIARSIPGVQKVVRVLEIISEEELQGMPPRPTPAEPKK